MITKGKLHLNTVGLYFAMLEGWLQRITSNARDPTEMLDLEALATSTAVTTAQQPTGVAVIALEGVVYSKAPDWAEDWGYVSPQRFATRVLDAANDPSIYEIILDINSPGGTVLGIYEAAAAVRMASSMKPVTAVANELMASAAYWIASGATRVVATPLATIGSIGVITAHADYSKMLEAEGIDLKIYRTGTNKALGQMVDPNDETMQEDVGGELNTILAMFASEVAASRGMSVEAIVALEGRTFIGAQAIEIGLADGMGTLQGEISRALQSASGNQAQAARKRRAEMDREELALLLGCKPEDITAEMVRNLVAQSKDGEAYRNHLLEQYGAALIGVGKTAQQAERLVALARGAKIGDLKCLLDDAEEEKQAKYPAGQLSLDHVDTPLEGEKPSAAVKKKNNWSTV